VLQHNVSVPPHLLHRSLCVGVYCSALQCVSVCCSVLQCVAVCHNVLQCDAICSNVFQFVAGVLQVCCGCVAGALQVYCVKLQHNVTVTTAVSASLGFVCCSVL